MTQFIQPAQPNTIIENVYIYMLNFNGNSFLLYTILGVELEFNGLKERNFLIIMQWLNFDEYE